MPGGKVIAIWLLVTSYPFRLMCGDTIARILTLAFIGNEQTLVNQFFNIPLRSGDRALRDDSPLASRKVALEAIENSIEHIPLAFIERDPCVALPEMDLTQDRSAGNFSGIKRGKGKGVRSDRLKEKKKKRKRIKKEKREREER